MIGVIYDMRGLKAASSAVDMIRIGVVKRRRVLLWA